LEELAKAVLHEGKRMLSMMDTAHLASEYASYLKQDSPFFGDYMIWKSKQNPCKKPPILV